MKKFIIAVVVIAAIVVTAVAFLHLTAPSSPVGVRFPLTPNQVELLASVPASAQSFALIPTAGAVYSRLRANPMTSEAAGRWADAQRLPQPWMIGAADLLIWKSGRETGYAIRLDALRATVVRLYLMIGADIDGRWSNRTFLINAPVETPIGSAEMSSLLSLASTLPPGDALAVHRETDRFAFPPIRRPAVTSVRLSSSAIDITSRAPNASVAPSTPLRVRYARSALLTAAFAAPPRMFDDLNRLLMTRVSPLVGNGGGITLYDIDTGTFLPRPKGVLFLPADDQRREELRRIERGTAGMVQTAEQNGQLIVSFDGSSLGRFTTDSFDDPHWPANVWALRLDPQRAVPILKRLGSSAGLRIAAPRLYRAARDLGSWISPLEQAQAIEATASSSGGTEELRVVVTSK